MDLTIQPINFLPTWTKPPITEKKVTELTDPLLALSVQ